MAWLIDVFRQIKHPNIPEDWQLPDILEKEVRQAASGIKGDFCVATTIILARLGLEMSLDALRVYGVSEENKRFQQLASFNPKDIKALQVQHATLTRYMATFTLRDCHCALRPCHCVNAHVVCRHAAFLLRCLSEALLWPSTRSMQAIVAAFLAAALSYRRLATQEQYDALEQRIVSEFR